MEILLPTAEKQNDIQTKVNGVHSKLDNVQYYVGDIHYYTTQIDNKVKSLSASKPYAVISQDVVQGVHAGTTDRKLVYSVKGNGFIEKFIFRINTIGLYETIVDGVVTQKISIGSLTPVGFLQAEDRKYSSGSRIFYFGEDNYQTKASLIYPHTVVNTTAYESATVSEVPPINFEKSFEVYFTPYYSANYTFTSHRTIRGGVY